jgi:hypothetical protein
MRLALTAAVCLTVAALAVGLILVHLFGDLPAALDTLSRADEVAARAEDSLRDSDRRRAGKDRAAEAALAGRLTLLQAAAAWRDLDAGLPPGQLAAWRLQADGDTDGERYCREVLARARALAEGRPDGGEAAERLGRQLEDALAGEDIRLPGPGAPGGRHQEG